MLIRFLLGTCLSAGLAAVADPAPALRLLRDACVGCHKPGKAKGGLILTTREKLLAGGDTGVAIVEGKGADSLLIKTLGPGHDPHMPPKKQLSAADIATLRAWVDGGAGWDAKVFDELPAVAPVKLGAMPASYQPVLALALSADGKHLALARGHELCVHDVSNPDRPVEETLHGHTEAIESVAWSPDGKTLASGGFRSVKIWDAETWREVKALGASLVGNVTSLCFGKDDSTLFAADGQPGVSGFVHRIDFTTGKLLSSWKAHEDVIYGMAITQDGASLGTGSADKLARLWKVSDGALAATFEGHTNHVLAVAFNKDATQLATAGADKEVKVWNTKTREQIVSLGDKKTAFTTLAWSADGSALVAFNNKGAGTVYRDLVSHDGSQRSDAAKERRLESVGVNVCSCAISADGKTVFAGGQAGVVRVLGETGKMAGQLVPLP